MRSREGNWGSKWKVDVGGKGCERLCGWEVGKKGG